MHVQALKILLKIWYLKFYLWQNKFSRLNKLSEQKGKNMPIFAVEITKQSDRIYKKQIICYMVHLRRKANIYICCGREKGHYDPILWCVQFPFYSPLLADARGKCDEAAEHTFYKLRASGNLLVSTPPHPNLPKATLAFSCNLFSSIFTL